jgi:hypothetical protein
MRNKNNRPQEMLAEFDNPKHLLEAANKLRDAGYKKFDCHSPFPIHGMDAAMGLKRSPLGYIVFVVAFLSLSAGALLEWWTSTIDYPLVISGKPFFSYQAYGPVAFAIMVLCSAFVALFGMLALNKLPMYFHKLFFSSQFTKVTNDGFFISIENSDPKFDLKATEKFLTDIGGKKVEVLSEE